MSTGFYPADILLPYGQNMKKWSVVACDQYTGSPEYWKEIYEWVGSSPSTLHLTLPEIFLGQPGTEARIDAIHKHMEEYLEERILRRHLNTMVYVERTLENGRVRKGLVGALDLEAYDFTPGALSLCRPTEETVASRIPPRQKVRMGAPLESPHALILIDDASHSVIAPLEAQKEHLKKVYDFELMQHGGHIKGYTLNEALMTQVNDALTALKDASQQKYGSPLLYLVGDGNHSIATAKACYERLKKNLGEKAKEHPARYMLVEITNLHSSGTVFEPIHRVLYNVNKADLFAELSTLHPQNSTEGQTLGIYADGVEKSFTLTNPTSKLTVGTLQPLIDDYIARHPEVEVDYIHEEQVLKNCCKAKNSVGFILPAIEKDCFFESIVKDGILPRKTFSMGESNDKRYYLECRKITL